MLNMLNIKPVVSRTRSANAPLINKKNREMWQAKKTHSVRTEWLSCPSTPQTFIKNTFRIVVLGSPQTGKTAIVNRFLYNRFDETYTPTIENFHRKVYKIRGEVYQLDVVDTAGNDPFPAARRLTIMTGDLFIVVYSVENSGSYDEALRLREQILQCKANLIRADSRTINVPIVIVANKFDVMECKYVVKTEDARMQILKLPSCTFVECSAKLDLRVDDVFAQLFLMAKLPRELSPKLQRKLIEHASVDAETGVRNAQKITSPLRRLKSKRSEMVLEVRTEEVIRRPSLRTDLLLMRAKASGSDLIGLRNDVTKNSGSKDRCVIQ